MSKTIIAAFIGAGATIIAAVIGVGFGKSSEQKSIQNEINEVMGDMVNVIGDGNEITINDIKDLVEDYQNLQVQNKSLTDQNVKYFDELTEANNKIEDYENQSNTKVQELERQLDDKPDIQFMDFALSIDGNDIPINKSKSMAVIDGREYVAQELAEKFLPDDKNIIKKDNILYIGKVVSEKSNLFDKHINSAFRCGIYDTQTDSYGNKRTNVLYFSDDNTHNIVFVMDKEYNYLKLTISVSDNAKSDKTGVVVVKADGETVYTSESINKQTAPFEKQDIAINNCKLLTIEYNSDYYNQCIISDAILYN